MKGNIHNYLEIPADILAPVYEQKMQRDFFDHGPVEGVLNHEEKNIYMIMAKLPKVLDWLHGQEQPQMLEKKPCAIPLLLFDQQLSFEKLLFHYDGTQDSAHIIHGFLEKFELHIKHSQATIISPSFIPKSKLQEEQALIQLIRNYTSETSFIKFNFRKIGDFWSYATKNKSTMLVTSKAYQADLAKVLFHFYKGGFWYDNLSFYLA
ncbi:hypothetical protein KZP23_20530 [Echinicola marina]|uniref:hypothetical protein n=1 Tax=Echinicola marina TaxID=2859768 RepID=UPI001CF62E74|nr:hypothetical protein [Echinicola marina]UCS93020.1 hypothetical protein KZP23_20530 [Echinicola marina]